MTSTNVDEKESLDARRKFYVDVGGPDFEPTREELNLIKNKMLTPKLLNNDFNCLITDKCYNPIDSNIANQKAEYLSTLISKIKIDHTNKTLKVYLAAYADAAYVSALKSVVDKNSYLDMYISYRDARGDVNHCERFDIVPIAHKLKLSGKNNNLINVITFSIKRFYYSLPKVA